MVSYAATVVTFIVALIISAVIIYVITKLFGETEGLGTGLIAAFVGTIIYTIVYYFLGRGTDSRNYRRDLLAAGTASTCTKSAGSSPWLLPWSSGS